MGSIKFYKDLALLKSFRLAIQAISKILKPYLLPNPKSEGVQIWWEALGPHRDLNLLKLIRSNI